MFSVSLGPVLYRQTNCAPLGYHEHADTPFGTFATRRGEPPATATIQSCARPGAGCCVPVVPVLSVIPRPDVNAIDLPSGDQRGALADHASSTICRGAELPSAATTQMDGTRRLRARSMRDDMSRLLAPARLPDSSPNPRHLDRVAYLARAAAAAPR